jgi:predicted nucleotide-binding protein
MISRFQGEKNRPNLVAALQRQKIVQNNEQLASELADVADLIQIEPGKPDSAFINQDGIDTDIYFILVGEVSICVNGREIAIRSDGQHVGEMAMIDTCARRCASVIALRETVLARISQHNCLPIADKYPLMWRQLAMELANRLRERSRYIKSPNPRPVIFIGSSSESRTIAYDIRDGLSYENVLPKAWTDDIFRVSATTIENLERELQAADFAVFVVGPDDVVISRDVEKDAPRDNVIWEHGFFAGGIGRFRTFIVKPRGLDIKMPSDLLGVTPLDYEPTGTADDLRARLGPAINGIRKAVDRLGPK